ncbi:hypothetical protein Actkin_05626 [Actinokineospora sp. UTMC 2448]|nr:hypothetical protein Actkin_05626 [Actinokineospora sp. UTMC 2448]
MSPVRALRRIRCHRWRDRVRAAELAARPPLPRVNVVPLSGVVIVRSRSTRVITVNWTPRP